MISAANYFTYKRGARAGEECPYASNVIEIRYNLYKLLYISEPRDILVCNYASQSPPKHLFNTLPILIAPKSTH